MEDVTCASQEFPCSHILSFCCAHRFQFIITRKYFSVVLCLNIPKINYLVSDSWSLNKYGDWVMLNQTSFLPQVVQDSAGCGVCRDPTHWLVGRAGSRQGQEVSWSHFHLSKGFITSPSRTTICDQVFKFMSWFGLYKNIYLTDCELCEVFQDVTQNLVSLST